MSVLPDGPVIEAVCALARIATVQAAAMRTWIVSVFMFAVSEPIRRCRYPVAARACEGPTAALPRTVGTETIVGRLTIQERSRTRDPLYPYAQPPCELRRGLVRWSRDPLRKEDKRAVIGRNLTLASASGKTWTAPVSENWSFSIQPLARRAFSLILIPRPRPPRGLHSPAKDGES